MRKVLILGSVVILLFGCSAQRDQTSFNVHTADFSKASDMNLCAVYGYRWNRSNEAKRELMKRNIFSDSDWKNIDQRRVKSGMSECAVKAAFALDYKKIVSKNFKDGSKGKSFVYSCSDNRVPYCPYTQVDMMNGIVTKVYKRNAL